MEHTHPISSEHGKMQSFVADCPQCNEMRARLTAAQRATRRAMKEAMESVGMRKTKGALGGTYWE